MSGSSTGDRTSYHHGTLRQALVDGARELLVEHGEAGFSLSELARRLGVSTAAPYRHFEDREALLAAVAEQGYEQLDNALRSASDTSTDPGTQILRMGVAYLTFATDNPAQFGIMFRQRNRKQTTAKPFQSLVDVVDSAQHSGVLRADVPARMLARTIWSTVHGLASLVLAGGLVRLDLDDTPQRLAMDTLGTFLTTGPAPTAAISPTAGRHRPGSPTVEE